jgi:prevent-host-death family protein
MASVSLHEAKTHLSSLIARIERKGETILISKHGLAVAELGPVSKASRTKVSNDLKKIRFIKDPCLPTTGEWNDV